MDGSCYVVQPLSGRTTGVLNQRFDSNKTWIFMLPILVIIDSLVGLQLAIAKALNLIKYMVISQCRITYSLYF